MPSPFLGMDPYIEQPDFWPDFHNNLAPEIQRRLNRLIQPRYVARLNPRDEYEAVEIGELRIARPDVAVSQPQPRAAGAPAGVLTISPAPEQSRVPIDEPLILNRVEIRALPEQQLVTVIEILSPANKRPGSEDQATYLQKPPAL